MQLPYALPAHWPEEPKKAQQIVVFFHRNATVGADDASFLPGAVKIEMQQELQTGVGKSIAAVNNL